MKTLKMFKRLLTLSLAACMILSCLAAAACGGGNGSSNSNEFVIKDSRLKASKTDVGHDRVFYEIFVGSFSDSNGDGIGDIRGIIDRMDYLNDGDPDSGRSLGVEGLWLTPIFTSPSYHKYDVADYYEVDPQFGTEEDLKELLDICHKRGVYVILDLPINHTSRRNEWFKGFIDAHRQNDTESEYYDLYCWYDADKQSAPAGRTYSQLSGTNHFYECNFSGDMPELDFDNENVRQKVLDVAEYYLKLGVDGFRFDAAKYIYYGDNRSSYDFWVWYMAALRQIKEDVYVVAEVWDGDGITDIYFPVMNCFDFSISQTNGLIAETAKRGNANRYTKYVQNYISRVKAMRESACFTPFISNHDMDRCAGYLTVASGNMKMGANLYLLGPGTPFIYYGEELGMRGSRGGENTDANRRLAMIWGDEDTVKDPSGSSYPASSQIETGAAEQLMDENSLYTYYKKLLMIRKANPEIACGEYKALDITDSKVGGFVSTLDGSSVIVLHNTTISAVEIDLSAITDIAPNGIAAVIGMEDATLNGSILTIGAQTSVVLR